MKSFLTLLVLCYGLGLTAQPFATRSSDNIDSLLLNIFEKEACFDYEPILLNTGVRTVAGNLEMQTGYFTGGEDYFGLNEGIILSTGSVKDAAKSNASFLTGVASAEYTSESGIPVFPRENTYHQQPDSETDLNVLRGGPSDEIAERDVAVLEFKIIPTSNTISFDYVFFSEEYCDGLTTKGINDNFAFFLDGPNPNPLGSTNRNIAKLPDGATVSITNVNPDVNPAFFINNNAPGQPNECQPQNPPPPQQLNAVAYNAWTVPLTATAEVIPCNEYILKLMVYDVSDTRNPDALFDSGVLLEAGSFLAGLISEPEPRVAGVPGVLETEEGCDTATITFSRLLTDPVRLQQPLQVNYNLITTTGIDLTLAEEGVDFELPPPPFFIPAGDSTAVLKIPIVADNDNNEGLESFVLRYDGTCNCAENSDTFTIRDSNLPSFELPVDRSECASTTVTLAPTNGILGGRPPYSFDWGNGVTDSVFNYQTTGNDTTITLTVTDFCGNAFSDDINFSRPNFSTRLSGDASLCTTNPAGLDLIRTGVGPLTVELSIDSLDGGNRTEIYTTTQDTTLWFDFPATVNLTAVTNLSGCQGGALNPTAVISGTDVVARPLLVTDSICFGDAGVVELDSTFNVAAAVVWRDAPLVTRFRRTDLNEGTYAFRVFQTANPDCFSEDSVTLVRLPELRGNLPANPGALCADETLNITASVTGGRTPYTYDWEGFNDTGGTLETTSQPGQTTYRLRVTDGCGDSTIVSTQTDFPNVSATLDSQAMYNLCNGPVMVGFDVEGANDYIVEWTQNGTRFETRPNEDFSITLDAETDVQLLSVQGDNCPGEVFGSVLVEERQWRPRLTTQGVDCRGAAAGAMAITIDNGDPTVNYTYELNGTVTAPDRGDLLAGDYTLNITDDTPEGCVFDTTFTITEPASAVSFVDDTIVGQRCDEMGFVTANFSGGTLPLSYRWQTGNPADTFPFLGPLMAGTYVLEVTDANGCPAPPQSFTVADLRTTITADIQSTETTLDCRRTSLELRGTSSEPDAVYFWLNGDGDFLSDNPVLLVTQPDDYTLVALDTTTGCFGEDDLMITDTGERVDLRLPFGFLLTCETPSVDIVPDLNGFNGAVDYQWRNTADPNTVISTAPTINTPTTSGDYELTIIRQDNDCASTATTSVVVDRRPPTATVATPDPVLTCDETSVDLRIDMSPGTILAWSTTDGNFTGPADQALIVTDQPGRYQATVTNLGNGCETTLNVDVTENLATASADAGPDQFLDCTEMATLLEGSSRDGPAGTLARWYDAEDQLIATDFRVFVRAAGTYTLETVHPESGCSTTDRVVIDSEVPTAIERIVTDPPCPEIGGRVTVTSIIGSDNGPFTFSSPGGRSLANGVTGLRTGTHVLTVTDNMGCSLVDTIEIGEPSIFASQSEELTVRIGDEVELGVTTNRLPGQLASWSWTGFTDTTACTDCPNPRFRPLESFIAEVRITDAFGCVLQAEQRVRVDERELVYIPTAFSPINQDGVNDVLTVYGRDEFVEQVNILNVYNRWGSLVFSNAGFPVNDLSAGWDGMYNGDFAPSGVYIYSGTVTLYDGTAKRVAGEINLIR